MARSSKVDAIEKFRFSVFILNVGFDPISLTTNFTGFLRGGFTEVSPMPRQVTGSIEYRENLDNTHPQLSPGITRYEPITLRRGVTSSSDFFRWANTVHDAGGVVATSIQRLKGDDSAVTPPESQNFRRDVLIVMYGRGGGVDTGAASNIPGVAKVANIAGAVGLSVVGIGDVTKAIMLRECWVSGYATADNLTASEDSTKAIEEIELRYESFEEITPEAIGSRVGEIIGEIGGEIGAAVIGTASTIIGGF